MSKLLLLLSLVMLFCCGQPRQPKAKRSPAKENNSQAAGNDDIAPSPNDLLPPTAEDDSLAAINAQCLFQDKYPVKERRQLYPFNEAEEVRLISFHLPGMEPVLKKKNGKIILPALRENILLTSMQTDSLTSLFYNVGRTPVKNLRFMEANPGMKCYEPRNGILFIKGGKAFEFIEICFACRQYELSSDNIEIWCYCEQKYDLIKRFFKDQGILIGTVKELPFEEWSL